MKLGDSVAFLAARPFRADSLRDPCRRQTNYERRNVSAALIAPRAIWRKVAVHSLRSYVLAQKPRCRPIRFTQSPVAVVTQLRLNAKLRCIKVVDTFRAPPPSCQFLPSSVVMDVGRLRSRTPGYGASRFRATQTACHIFSHSAFNGNSLRYQGAP
jgi:hypothetical protein